MLNYSLLRLQELVLIAVSESKKNTEILLVVRASTCSEVEDDYRELYLNQLQGENNFHMKWKMLLLVPNWFMFRVYTFFGSVLE